MLKSTILFIYSILLLLLLSKIFSYYFSFYWAYMWNTPKKWNKYIEKPRLAIFSIFIPTIFCSFYGLHAITFKLSAFNIIMIIGLMILILIISFILIISMDNKRIKVIAPYFEEKINKSSEKQKKHIGVSKTNTIELETLYKELKKYDLIEIDKTSIKDFVNALTNSLRHKESKVFLSKKMDILRLITVYLKRRYLLDLITEPLVRSSKS